MNVWDNLHNIPPLIFKIWMDNQIYLGKNEWMFGPREARRSRLHIEDLFKSYFLL